MMNPVACYVRVKRTFATFISAHKASFVQWLIIPNIALETSDRLCLFPNETLAHYLPSNIHTDHMPPIRLSGFHSRERYLEDLTERLRQ